jgi:hypothetical protein
MENRENQNPSAGSESDISKSQSQQQPSTSQDQKRPPNADQSDDQAATGQDQSAQAANQAGFGETATQQRSDVEGSSIDKQPTGEAESGFVGSEGETDTSSELVEDEDQDFSKGGQGAPEGK